MPKKKCCEPVIGMEGTDCNLENNASMSQVSSHSCHTTAVGILFLLAALASATKSSPSDEWPEEKRPMHTMWGAEDVQDTWHHQLPKGVKLVTSQEEIKKAFGIEDDYVDVSK
jgi:hypothetical protein